MDATGVARNRKAIATFGESMNLRGVRRPLDREPKQIAVRRISAAVRLFFQVRLEPSPRTLTGALPDPPAAALTMRKAT